MFLPRLEGGGAVIRDGGGTHTLWLFSYAIFSPIIGDELDP